jgi:hypothetical protein
LCIFACFPGRVWHLSGFKRSLFIRIANQNLECCVCLPSLMGQGDTERQPTCPKQAISFPRKLPVELLCAVFFLGAGRTARLPALACEW